VRFLFKTHAFTKLKIYLSSLRSGTTLSTKSSSDVVYDRAFFLFFIFILAVVLFTFMDYGMNYDEPVHNQYGRYVLNYYSSFFHDKKLFSYYTLYMYGAFFDLICAIANKISFMGEFETRHLINAFFGLFGLLGCWKIVRSSFNSKTAFWSVIFLTTIPMYYGHMFNNPKDIPLAALYIWGIYYLAQSMKRLPNIPKRLIIKLGIIIGLAIGVRIGGLLLLAYTGLVFTLFFFRHPNFSCFKTLLAKIFYISIITYLIMLVLWPWSHYALFTSIYSTAKEMLNFSRPIPLLFEGKNAVSTDLPWYYLPKFFFIQLPEILILLLPLLFIFWRNFKKKEYLLLFLSAFFPLLFAMIMDSSLYDATRHFLFIIPSLACLFGIVFVQLTERCNRKIVYVVTILFLIYHLSIMIKLHPNEYIYYNQTVGGLSGAYQNYETDYSGNSYKEGVSLLANYLTDKNKKYKICVCKYLDDPIVVSYYFPKNFILVNDPSDAQYYISFTRWYCDQQVAGNEILDVERFGVPLTIIKELH